MRFIVFLIISILCFSIVFWLTFDYSLVKGIGLVEAPNGYVLHVESYKLPQLFAQLSEQSEYYSYNVKTDDYSKLSLEVESTVGMFNLDGGITVVLPSSFSSYKLNDGKLESISSTSRFGKDPENVQSFVCSAAILQENNLNCYGVTSTETGSRILRTEILNGVASDPVLVKSVEIQVANLEIAYTNGKTLLLWTNQENPKEIYYEVVSEKGSFGGLTKFDWAGKWYGYFPYFLDTSPGLLMLKEESNSFDFYNLKEDKISSQDLYSVDFEGKPLTSFAWEGDSAFCSDGTNILFLKKQGNKFVAVGKTSVVGNAHFSPQIMQLISQLILILLLIAFSFMMAFNRRKISAPFSILHPSNLMIRASAFIIDGVIASIISAGVFFVLLLILGESLQISLLSQEELKLFQNVSVSVIILYGTIFEALFLATPGKMIFKITIISTRTIKPGFLSIFVRNLMKPVDLLLLSFLVTPALMIFTPMNQRLGDLLASTVIVDGKKKDVHEFTDNGVLSETLKDREIEIKSKPIEDEDVEENKDE